MTFDPIEIHGQISRPAPGGSQPPPLSPDHARDAIQQMAADATTGTFGELPKSFGGKWDRDPQDLQRFTISGDAPPYTFSILLDRSVFPVRAGGLQHLIGVLAGDLFYRDLPVIGSIAVKVQRVELPASMRKECLESNFGGRDSNSFKYIRKFFSLGEFRPLLAFSFKPRMGLRFDAFREEVLAAAGAGINLIEPDTRDITLAVVPGLVDKMGDLARDVATAGKQHVCRLGINCTLPADLAVAVAEQFAKKSKVKTPLVLKVDGGLDGIATVQALRRSRVEQVCQAVITCYPLLRDSLSHVPRDLYLEALRLSGVDILYPGGRPVVAKDAMAIGGAQSNAFKTAVARYDKFVSSEGPVPSIAGGVHAGELHTFYELFGPNVAFFLGGAITLANGGIAEGAKLCSQTLDALVNARSKASGREPIKLSDPLIRRLSDAYIAQRKFDYITPEECFGTPSGVPLWHDRFRPSTWGSK